MTTLLITDDNFNRSNVATQGTGGTGIGSPSTVGSGVWTELNGGVWAINSNLLKGTGDGISQAYQRDVLLRPLSEFCQDQQVVITCDTSMTAGAQVGAVLRYDPASGGSYYAVMWNSSTMQLNGYRISNGVQAAQPFGVAMTGLTTFTAGHVYTVTCKATGVNSTTISIQVTDVTASSSSQTASATDATAPMQSAVKGWGLAMGLAATVPISRVQMTDLGAASLVATTPVTVAIPTNTPYLTLPPSATTTVTLRGNSAAWLTVPPVISLSGAAASGSSAGSVTVIDNNHATVPITVGSTTGTLTITDTVLSLASSLTVAATPVTIAINDSHWSWSGGAGGWYISGSTYAQCTNGGNYLKTAFTGTSCQLTLDLSPFASSSLSKRIDLPFLRWSVDGGAWSGCPLAENLGTVTQPPGQIPVVGTLTISSGLSAGTHSLECYVVSMLSSTASMDRWTTPVQSLRITGMVLDNGASTSAPTLLSKKTLFYGDSITEGYSVISSVTPGFEGQQTWGPELAIALGCEYAIAAFAGQGLVTAEGSPSNIPALYNATATLGTWDRFDGAPHSRLSSGSLSPAPDYIVVNIGTNDRSGNQSTVCTTMTALLGALRTAAASATIIVIVPFGGGSRGSGTTLGITGGFNAYQAATPDTKCYLIDIGNVTGMTYVGASKSSADGTHPNIYEVPLLATQVTQAVQAKLSAGSGGGGSGHHHSVC